MAGERARSIAAGRSARSDQRAARATSTSGQARSVPVAAAARAIEWDPSLKLFAVSAAFAEVAGPPPAARRLLLLLVRCLTGWACPRGEEKLPRGPARRGYAPP